MLSNDHSAVHLGTGHTCMFRIMLCYFQVFFFFLVDDFLGKCAQNRSSYSKLTLSLVA